MEHSHDQAQGHDRQESRRQESFDLNGPTWDNLGLTPDPRRQGSRRKRNTPKASKAPSRYQREKARYMQHQVIDPRLGRRLNYEEYLALPSGYRLDREHCLRWF